LGAPLTGRFAPLATSTSQIRPGFSVTRALLLPGRKAMAQGELNVAMGEILNGGSPDGWTALAEGADPQDASIRKHAACIARNVIEPLPFP
jgi:hypothetical protein